MAAASRTTRRARARASRRADLRALVDLWVDLFARHNLLTYASAIAFQTLIAAVALALLAIGVLGESGARGVWNDTVGPAIQAKVLHHVYLGVDQVVQKIFSTSSVGLIAFAAAFAVWEMSGVVRASMGALNQIYDTDENRPWWIRFPISFGLAAGVIASLIGSMLIVVAVHVAGPLGWVVAVLRWLVSIALVSVAFALIVRFAPCERRAKKWATAGATLVVVSWIVESLIFRWYVSSVANFRTAVGSLTVFLVLTAYLYVAAIILLVALELDELLRKDLQEGEEERGILELVRGLL